ncbi:MAG: hypothetical protein QGG36_23065 [Pirellulaceae bacterium]|nr:hypothetical protein [Pirellulaceae bacterium]
MTQILNRRAARLTLFLSALLFPISAYGGGEAEHRHMIAALAHAVGFSDRDAKVISDGSWSMDENAATLAFRSLDPDAVDYVKHRVKVTTDGQYAQSLLQSDAEFDKTYLDPKGSMSRIGPSSIVHSLMSDPRGRGDANTPGLDHAFHSYIRDQSQQLRADGASLNRTREAQLLLYGQYMHQVVDSFVHPHEPIQGHALQGHAPDRAITHPAQYTRAAVKVLQLMRTMPEDLRPNRHRAKSLQLGSAEGQTKFASGLVGSMAAGYKPAMSVPGAKTIGHFTSAVEKVSLPLIKGNIEAFLNDQYGDADLPDEFAVPEFSKATYSPEGADFAVEYGGEKYNVANIVQWLRGKDEFSDLLDSVRDKVRQQIKTWREQGLSAIEIVRALKGIGGVTVRFHPGSPGKQIDDDRLRDIVDQATAAINGEGDGGLVLRLDQSQQTFQVVSLSKLLRQKSRTLGSLTRLRGYIIQDDDIILVGHAEDGRPLIDADLFTVALNTIYKHGAWPYVSIDQDPLNPFGDQLPRIGGVPQKYRDSEFVRIMLDADYDMKRIGLGEIEINAPGFLSLRDILARVEGPVAPELRRYWLAPLMATTADVLQNWPAVLFESRVQVLTERMKQASEYLVSSRPGDSNGERAADHLTWYYDQIEQEVDSFYRLHGLFDVAKFCAVLRFKKVEHQLLEKAAERPTRRVNRRDGRQMLDPYDGIGPKVIPGTVILVGGGASSRQRLRGNAFANSDAVGRLVDGERTLTLEAAVPLSRANHPEILFAAAVRDLGAGDADGCVSKCTKALRVDPEFTEARIFRALAFLEGGRSEEALADLDQVVQTNPRFVGLRGVALLRTGDRRAALQAVDQATKQFPDDEAVWMWCGFVRAFALDLPGAKVAVDRLTEMNPASEHAETLLGVMLWFQRLDEDDARLWSESMLKLPFGILESLADGFGAIEQLNFAASVDHFQRALELAELNQHHESVKSLHVLERTLMSLAYAEAINARFAQALAKTSRDTGPRSDGAVRRDADEEPRKVTAEVPPERGGKDGPGEPLERTEPRPARAGVRDVERAEGAVVEPPIPGVAHADRLIRMHPDWPSGYFSKALCGLVQPNKIENFEPSELIEQGLNSPRDTDPLWKEWRIMLGDEDPVRAMHAMGLQLSINGLIGLAKSGGGGPAEVRGRLPTPYLRRLAKEPDITGKMAAAMLPYFELVDLASSLEQQVRALPPDANPDKEVAREFVRRFFPEAERGPLFARIEAAQNGNDLEKPMTIAVVRKILGDKRSRDLVDRINKAPSMNEFAEDMSNVRAIVDAMRQHFRDVYLETRGETLDDMAATQVFSLFMLITTLSESVLGDAEFAMSLAADHVKRLPDRANAVEGNRNLGHLRFYANLTLVGAHVLTAHRDLIPPIPGFRPARGDSPAQLVAAGKLQPAELVTRMRKRDQEFLELTKKQHSEFTYEITGTFVRPLRLVLPMMPLNMAREACERDEDLDPDARERILAAIQTEQDRMQRDLVVWGLDTFLRTNENLTAADKRQMLVAVGRGEDPAEIVVSLFRKMIRTHEKLDPETRDKLLQMFSGDQPSRPDANTQRAFFNVVGDAMAVVDIYAIWNPLVRAADTPSELEATRPLLMIMDLATSIIPMRTAGVDPTNPVAQQITRHLTNSMTAGKSRLYEQVRLKTIRFQKEELRLSP